MQPNQQLTSDATPPTNGHSNLHELFALTDEQILEITPEAAQSAPVEQPLLAVPVQRKDDASPTSAAAPSTTAAPHTAVVFLINISAEKWPPRHRTYFGSLEVRSPEPGEVYAVTTIRGCTGVMDLGDKRTMEYRITAREIAEDIAREINSDSGEGSFHGVFVAAGSTPTEAELADARRRLEEFQRRLVAAADLEWERTKNPMFITDLERRAARQLHLEKPWLYDPKPLAECPVCAEKIKHGVAVCRSCGAILDREKAAQYGLVPAEGKSSPQKNVEQKEKREREAAKPGITEAKQ